MTKKTWKIAFAFGLPWAVFMIVYKSIVNNKIELTLVVTMLFFGLITGILFALLMQYTAKNLYRKTLVETTPDERIIKEGGANHFKGREGVGGKLVLTNKRLIFKSHKYNVQNHQDSFDLAQIESAQATKTLKFLNNGLILALNNSEKHKFVVDEPNDWASVIISQKALN